MKPVCLDDVVSVRGGGTLSDDTWGMLSAQRANRS